MNLMQIPCTDDLTHQYNHEISLTDSVSDAVIEMSQENLCLVFLTRSEKNGLVQLQKKA